jgi:hypothetical protein
MAITYINIFLHKALQIYPNWDFWFENKPSGNLDLAFVGSDVGAVVTISFIASLKRGIR